MMSLLTGMAAVAMLSINVPSEDADGEKLNTVAYTFTISGFG